MGNSIDNFRSRAAMMLAALAAVVVFSGADCSGSEEPVDDDFEEGYDDSESRIYPGSPAYCDPLREHLYRVQAVLARHFEVCPRTTAAVCTSDYSGLSSMCEFGIRACMDGLETRNHNVNVAMLEMDDAGCPIILDPDKVDLLVEEMRVRSAANAER